MKVNNIKMIAIDMDGTLLTTDKKLTEHSIEILKAAIDKGVELVVASGRPQSGIPKEYMALPGVRYAITANGARVLDMKTGEKIYEALVPQDRAKQILDIFAEYDSAPELYKEGRAYMKAGFLERMSYYMGNPAMAEYVKKSRTQVEDLQEILEKYPDGFEKVQALFHLPEEQMEAKQRVAEIEGVKPVTSLDYNVEVSLAGADKGHSLVILAEKLGIAPEEIMSFGDNDNDLEMIRFAGMGVAMKNAIPEILEAADYVTDSNDQEGVAKAIEKFILNDNGAAEETGCGKDEGRTL